MFSGINHLYAASLPFLISKERYVYVDIIELYVCLNILVGK